MRRSALVSSAFAALALSPIAVAQRTWIVADDGSGDFTDLPAALAVAVHGDVVELRPPTSRASYAAGATNQGLTIRGESCATRLTGAMRVHDLPAGTTFALERVCSDTGSAGLAVDLADNRGVVFVDAVTAMPGLQRPLFRATDCDLVVVAGSVLANLEFVRCDVLITRSNLIGTSFGSADPALRSIDSDVTLSQPIVRPARIMPPAGSPFVPRPGIDATGGRLEIRGDALASITGGADFRAGIDAPAVRANAGQLEIDPRIRLGAAGAPPPHVTGTSILASIERPFLDLSPTRSPIVHGRDASVAVQLLSILQPPTPTIWGNAWVDVGWSHVFDIGTIRGGRRGGVYLQPAVPIGTFVAFQAAVVEPSGALWFTNPALIDIGTTFP